MALTKKQKTIKFLTPIVLPFFRLYWRVFKPETFGVKVIIEHNGEYLWVRNSYGHRSITFPGGGIDKGETSEEAGKREVKEEVGLNLEEIKYVGKIVSTREGKIDNIDIYYTHSNSKDITLSEFEIEEGGWFRKDNPPKLSPTTEEIWEVYVV